MSDYVKKVLDRYREEQAKDIKSEMIVFRVTPEERDLLIETYGSMAGIRDFALASTDTNMMDIEDILEDKTKDAED